MEFKLNKIDTDIRKRMQEKIKDDKVHSMKKINIKRNLNEDKEKKLKKVKYKEEQENENKYITIDGVMYKKEKINIEVEKSESVTEENSKGRILDTIK